MGGKWKGGGAYKHIKYDYKSTNHSELLDFLTRDRGLCLRLLLLRSVCFVRHLCFQLVLRRKRERGKGGLLLVLDLLSGSRSLGLLGRVYRLI